MENATNKSGSTLRYVVYLFALGMLCAFGPLCTDIYLPGLPDISTYFGADPSVTQLSLTTAFLGLALGQVFVGPISDAVGRRIPLYISLVVFVVTSFLCAASSSIWMLIVFRFIQGMAGSGGLVLSRSIACDRFQGPELAKFMSLLMTINSVAPIVGPILGSLIITFASWQVIFIALAGWGILLVALCAWDVPESLPVEKREGHIVDSFVGMFKECLNLRFMLYVFSFSFVMAGFFGYLSASPFVFQVIYEFTPFQYSLVFGSIAICVSVTAMLAGRLVRRMGEIRIIVIAYIVMLLAALDVAACAFIEPASFVPVVAGLLVFCAMMGASQTAGFSVVMSVKKGGAGSASGLYGVMNFLFGAMATPLMGIMGDRSMVPLGLCLLICSLLAMWLFVWARRVRR